MAEAPDDTLICFLCKGFVSYKDGNPSKFNKHMNSEHSAYFGLDYLLAGCSMSPEERAAVREVIGDRIEPGKEGQEAGKQKEQRRHSLSAKRSTEKKKCPQCPISFTFQADLTEHMEVTHGVEEGSRAIMDTIDSKNNRELRDKIKDFNSANQELKKNTKTVPASDIKREAMEGGKVKGLAVKKFGPARVKLSKEEAWKIATSKRSTKSSEESEKSTSNKSVNAETKPDDKVAKSLPKKPSSKGEAVPLHILKKKLNLSSSDAETTPVKSKKSKLAAVKSQQHVDRSRTPNKKIAAAGDSPGKGTDCPLCGKQFPNNGPMRRHFEDIHQPGEYPCPGEGCGKVFTSKNKMSSHRSRNCNPNNPKAMRKSTPGA